MTRICLLLTVAAVPLIHGAAVSDLVSLFHQYEDEILGRGQGVNPDPVEISEEAAAGEDCGGGYHVSSIFARETRGGSWLGRQSETGPGVCCGYQHGQ